ncbi:GW dipeptide domain-containing protein [Trichococcus alkaliphilus]|uniref:GW dipeptide domain-containing protein n=1 Tax=Trichococcus alkaliphilus TaxID=2052943 RepID=UPI000D0AE787|nr:GW dipeptide domain-containing protein [Trichococcus alkaliphilus]
MIVQNKYLRTCLALSSMAASSLFFGNKYAYADEQNVIIESVPVDSASLAISAQQPASETGEAISYEEATQENELQAVTPEAVSPAETEEMASIGTAMPVSQESVANFKKLVLDPVYTDAKEISGTATPNSYIVFLNEDGSVMETSVDETGAFRLPVTGTAAAGVIKAVVYSNPSKTKILEESEWAVLPAHTESAEKTSAELTASAIGVGVINEEASLAEPTAKISETAPAAVAASSAEAVAQSEEATPTEEVSASATMSLMSVSSTTMTTVQTVVQEAKGTWYYYVQSGDTLKSIAAHYATNTDSLIRWNYLTDANLIYVGQLLSVNGTNVYSNIDKETRTFASSAEFVEYLGGYATEIGKEYNLYSSVMVAQASLETAYGTSKLGTVGNNLFGIKGSYQGNSIVMRTWEEESDGSVIWIDAFFRLYPSYYESMVDYALKLRNGVSWDANFYKGTWIENTTSYKDATLYLTGRYATDSSYNTKLNAIISAYGLTKFDQAAAAALKTVSADYNALVSGYGYSIDSLPWGTTGYKYIASSTDYYGKEVHVSKKTADGNYAYISIGAKEVGWVDSDALKTFATVSVSYSLPIMDGSYSIDSLPYGYPGYKKVADAASYTGNVATVVRETADGAFAEIKINGAYIGWVSKKAFNAAFQSYDATIRKSGYSIDSLPWGTTGYRTLAWSNDLIGKSVKVIGKSANGAYFCISYNTGAAIGWVDYKAFEYFNSAAANYNAVVSKSNFSIDSLPWGEAGYAYVASSSSYLGKEVNVSRITADGNYAFISFNGKGLGWIDSKGLQTFATRTASYSMPIMNGIYSIDSLPWGVSGFAKVADASAYFGKMATIYRESADGAYAEIGVDGRFLGWIDKRSFSNAKQVDYYVGVSGLGYSIDSLPWGTAGYKQVGNTNSYLGNLVKVIAETTDGAYKLVQKSGQTLGWVDHRALTALSTKAATYSATIRSSGYSIDSLPWGTAGFTLLSLTNYHLNTPVQVIQETADGCYALVAVNGQTLGWVDKRCF